MVFTAGPATDPSAPALDFTCALLNSTDVACAGYNGALRLGRTGGALATPALVPTDAGADAGDAGPPRSV